MGDHKPKSDGDNPIDKLEDAIIGFKGLITRYIYSVFLLLFKPGWTKQRIEHLRANRQMLKPATFLLASAAMIWPLIKIFVMIAKNRTHLDWVEIRSAFEDIPESISILSIVPVLISVTIVTKITAFLLRLFGRSPRAEIQGAVNYTVGTQLAIVLIACVIVFGASLLDAKFYDWDLGDGWDSLPAALLLLGFVLCGLAIIIPSLYLTIAIKHLFGKVGKIWTVGLFIMCFFCHLFTYFALDVTVLVSPDYHRAQREERPPEMECLDPGIAVQDHGRRLIFSCVIISKATNTLVVPTGTMQAIIHSQQVTFSDSTNDDDDEVTNVFYGTNIIAFGDYRQTNIYDLEMPDLYSPVKVLINEQEAPFMILHPDDAVSLRLYFNAETNIAVLYAENRPYKFSVILIARRSEPDESYFGDAEISAQKSIPLAFYDLTNRTDP